MRLEVKVDIEKVAYDQVWRRIDAVKDVLFLE